MSTTTKYTKETLPVDDSVSSSSEIKSVEEKTSIQQDNAEISQDTLIPSENDSEESQSDAFNSETGEINWDCPCLGGMAKGTCGEQFKAAFSCFIYSTAEPKGVDCLEQFQKMKDCFKQHPEEYGEDMVTKDVNDSTITIASTEKSPNSNDSNDSSDKQTSEN
ncbi:14625_t:CDS:2 [Funneliformis caledonium]|uniref:Mitochondrial intermembrane space import and assembly protein 40 n=1 Tax=Funneliformis caledonium TaxID=1117310 RepID=A0A9N9B2D9_9GLOM|nr:14621_t:CDS:2 [Funneliformis caledonium]CAG8548758.1 14625_t:CDS:2 [Funneliformis caledonium]